MRVITGFGEGLDPVSTSSFDNKSLDNKSHYNYLCFLVFNV